MFKFPFPEAGQRWQWLGWFSALLSVGCAAAALLMT